jgi:hypothetical protein
MRPGKPVTPRRPCEEESATRGLAGQGEASGPEQQEALGRGFVLGWLSPSRQARQAAWDRVDVAHEVVEERQQVLRVPLAYVVQPVLAVRSPRSGLR